MGLEQYQSIITKYNTDTHGNPIAVVKVDSQMVHPTKYMIQTGLLDELYRFMILNFDMNEVFNFDDIKLPNDYFVDYNNGRAFFHEDMAGNTVQYKCAELGIDMINACRVVSDFDDKGNVKEKLSELIDEVNNAVVTNGILKENRTFNIPKESLVFNNITELYEYTLYHNLTSNNLNITVYDGDEPLLDLCRKLDSKNIIVANDEKIDLTVIINYGSIN